MRKIIIGNWKCNPVSVKEAKKLFDSIKAGLKNNKKTDVVICPPFVYLEGFSSFCRQAGSKLQLGAQNCFWQDKGAFTGEVSPKMLKDLGVKYVILGHSERREFFNETNEMVNKKIKAALIQNLIPIICIGETKEQRQKAQTFKILENQIREVLDNVHKTKINKLIIAYEPVWAIGKEPCSVNEAVTSILFIRKVISKLTNQKTARSIRIIYGGSVNSKNASEYLREREIDGLLVGNASLKASEFIKIAKY